jgi:N-acetylglucosaminyldiphosphoundecaprenol N-acetyl-beta-D-mannosaminyltransferase
MTKTASITAGIGKGDTRPEDTGRRLAAYSFLGIRVNPLTVPDLNALVSGSIGRSQQIVIACHNLHSVYVFHHDAKMQLLQKRVDYLHIDGMGIVLLGRLLGHPLRRQHRVTYLDWIEPLLNEAISQQWRVYYVGLRGSICTGIQEAFRRDLPDLQFKAAHWDIDNQPVSALQATILEDINAFQPHILFVGMGMPRQEHWILDHADRISANVILPCGAAMDYIAGAVKAPPRWAGQWGLEWLFRLASEPRHLWRRYLVEPWYVLRLFCLELVTAHSKSR